MAAEAAVREPYREGPVKSAGGGFVTVTSQGGLFESCSARNTLMYLFVHHGVSKTGRALIRWKVIASVRGKASLHRWPSIGVKLNSP